MKVQNANGEVREEADGYTLVDGETLVDENADADKGIDIEETKALLTAAMEKAGERIADNIVKNLYKGVKEQKAKVLAGQEIGKDAKADELTRKFMKAVLSGDTAGAKALTTSDSGSSPDDAKAGLLIPTVLYTEVMRIAEKQFGLARRDMFYLPFTGAGNERPIPTLGTSVSVSWIGEGAKKTSTQPKFSIVSQTLKKLAAIVPFTDEILEDSAVNLTNLIATLFAEAVAKEEDVQFFAGDGSPWTGILNNGDVNTVYQETAGVANITADDLLNMQDACPSGAQAGAKYYMHRSVFNKLRKLKGDDGQYVVQAPTATTPGTIWNKPYELSDAFPTASEVEDGTPYVLYGDLKMAAVFGDKQQLRIKMLDQATITDTDGQTGINLAEQDMTALRIVERVGYVLALPKAVVVLNSAESGS